MCDPAQRDDGAQPRHGLDRPQQKLPAGVDLDRQRLVLRRHAAHRIADAAVHQRQPVVWPGVIRAGRKAVVEQRGVEQVAGIVAGEWPPGAVGALDPGGEADNHQFGVVGPERGHRRIEPVGFARANGVAVINQPRAERTVAAGIGDGNRGAGSARGRGLLSPRMLRHRSWLRLSPAAGTGGRGAAQAVRPGRGPVSTAVPEDR